MNLKDITYYFNNEEVKFVIYKKKICISDIKLRTYYSIKELLNENSASMYYLTSKKILLPQNNDLIIDSILKKD